MSKLERGFIPIDEANTDNVRFAIDLPHHLERARIRANSRRIESMMRLGGISHLIVETFEADRVSSSPLIVGNTKEGGAYAGKVISGEKTKQVKLESIHELGSPTVKANVKLDIQALSASIAEKDLRSSEVWAHEIDRAVLAGLRAGGSKALLKDNTLYGTWYNASVYGAAAIYDQLHNGTGFQPDQMLFMYAVQVPLLYVVNNIRTLGGNRLSLFWGPELDRWVVLQGRTRLQHVVKAGDLATS